jgi:hypothetical protein
MNNKIIHTIKEIFETGVPPVDTDIDVEEFKNLSSEDLKKCFETIKNEYDNVPLEEFVFIVNNNIKKLVENYYFTDEEKGIERSSLSDVPFLEEEIEWLVDLTKNELPKISSYGEFKDVTERWFRHGQALFPDSSLTGVGQHAIHIEKFREILTLLYIAFYRKKPRYLNTVPYKNMAIRLDLLSPQIVKYLHDKGYIHKVEIRKALHDKKLRGLKQIRKDKELKSDSNVLLKRTRLARDTVRNYVAHIVNEILKNDPVVDEIRNLPLAKKINKLQEILSSFSESEKYFEPIINTIAHNFILAAEKEALFIRESDFTKAIGMFVYDEPIVQDTIYAATMYVVFLRSLNAFRKQRDKAQQWFNNYTGLFGVEEPPIELKIFYKKILDFYKKIYDSFMKVIKENEKVVTNNLPKIKELIYEKIGDYKNVRDMNLEQKVKVRTPLSSASHLAVLRTPGSAEETHRVVKPYEGPEEIPEDQRAELRKQGYEIISDHRGKWIKVSKSQIANKAGKVHLNDPYVAYRPEEEIRPAPGYGEYEKRRNTRHPYRRRRYPRPPAPKPYKKEDF